MVKNKYLSNDKTVDVQHTQFNQKIKQNNSELLKLQKKYDEYKLTLEKQEKSLLGDCDDKKRSQIIQTIIKLKEDIICIKDKISKIKCEYNEVEYLKNNASVLFNYYDVVEKKPSPPVFENDIIFHFQNFDSKIEDSRRHLLEKYVSKTDPKYMKQIKQDDYQKCEFCNSSDIMIMMSDGYQYCNNCYTMKTFITDHDKPSYKDPPKEISYFAYKRINHYSEWLNQIQGKETTEIPPQLYDNIMNEIKILRIRLNELTPDIVKEILKRLDCNKYYEHIPHIINKLNGKPMPILSPDLEERLKQMFKQTQTPFLKYSQNRKNFLSYSVVIHKFLQLLGHDELLVYFPLLKSREKLAEQDKIWKQICNDLGWEFIPSL